MSAQRLEATMARLDSVLDQRVRREELAEAEEARAREAARRQRQRDNAESRRVIAETYADAYASFGTEVPAPTDDEAPSAYRRRLYNRLARKLPVSHDLADLRADDLGGSTLVFDNFEKLLLDAAKAEGEHPSLDNLPPDGSLISRVRTDENNAKWTEYFGKESFIKDLGRPGRRVMRIVHPAHGVLWGQAF
jgi:hypothetical protein